MQISCAHLPKNDALSQSDPLVSIYMKSEKGAPYTYVGQTEAQKNQPSPVFATPVKCTVAPGFDIKVCVYDVDASEEVKEEDLIGYAYVFSGEMFLGQEGRVELFLLDNEGAHASDGKAMCWLDYSTQSSEQDGRNDE